MKKKSGRVLRPGRGKAFLRFLVGEMVLALVCVCVYLFVLQGTIELPGVEKLLRENVNLGDMSVNLPQVQTASPSPVPTSTPVPEALLSESVPLEQLGDLSQADSGWLKASLFSLSEAFSGERHTISISGHAYLEGMDAQTGSIYLLARDAQSGEPLAAWQTQSVRGANELSFEGANGANLDAAYYSACIDVTSLTGEYRLYVCVENGERIGLAPLTE